MKAYAILDGGGVKGAALAGCLKAAEERGIEFMGYGGTSAGSIVAFLACLGFSGDELHRVMTQEIRFKDFLDDGGSALERLIQLPESIRKSRFKPLVLWKYRDLLKLLIDNFGLYKARQLQDFLLRSAKQKFTDFENNTDISFEELKQKGCPVLKVVVSNLGTRVPEVHSVQGGSEVGGSVIDAVRASMSYPFVFYPVRMHNRFLVDGGLSTNLPLFVFEEERRRDGFPVIAFDLIAPASSLPDPYRITHFCGDMMATALESADYLQQHLLQGIYHVRIPVPPNIGTLDFSLTREQCNMLYLSGHSATHTFFSNTVPEWAQIRNQVERLRALHVPPRLVSPILEAMAREFESRTAARSVRSHVMLPTANGKRVVTYQYGMDSDPDVDLELDMAAGCSGRAWTTRLPVFADLEEAKTTFASTWYMTREQQNKVRSDRQAMLSLPIFDLRGPQQASRVNQLAIIGTLSVDTSTRLEDTGWQGANVEFAVTRGRQWADIVSRVLK